MAKAKDISWEKGWGTVIHPKVIMEDYLRFREKMGDCRNDPDDLQELFEAWYKCAFMAITTRKHPEITDKEIEIIQAAMASLQEEWARRYSYMIVAKFFGTPGKFPRKE